jgi:hypothetical protein
MFSAGVIAIHSTDSIGITTTAAIAAAPTIQGSGQRRRTARLI